MAAVFTVENLTRNRILAAGIRSAGDSKARRRGLLDEQDLDQDSGLWINPCEAIHTFGMQMPLDAVFLDALCCVRKVSAHLRPNRIAFCLSASSVLELKAGVALSSGTECGDRLVFRRVARTTGVNEVRR